MQPVSQEWIKNQLKPIVSKADLRLELYVANTDLYLPATTISGTDMKSFSNYSNLIVDDFKPKMFSLMGLNQWLLDGSVTVYENNNAYMPAVSSYVATRNAVFVSSSFPVLTITLPAPTTKKTRSIQINSGSPLFGYATEIEVAFNDADSTTVTAYPTDSVANISLNDVVGYSTITITIKKYSLPYRVATISSVFLGFVKTFTGDDVIDYEANEKIYLTNENLPQNETYFTIDNSQGVFDSDPNNTDPSNLYGYLSTRQRLVVSYGYNGEWIRGGTFYLSEWDCPQNGIVASFTLKNILSFMTEKYEYDNSATNLLLLANDACDTAGLPMNKRDFDADLASRSAMAIDDVTVAEVLQHIALATNKALFCDRYGVVHINDISSRTLDSSYVINLDNCYKYPEISLEEEVKQVTIGSTVVVNSSVTTGYEMEMDNLFIPNSTVANSVGNYYLDLCNKRVNYACELRIDPRIEVLDVVSLVSKNNNNSGVIITGSKISYNGSFSGVLEAKEWL